MEQLLRELRAYLKLKYSPETIKQVGLEEDEDVARLLKDNRELDYFNPELIIDEYIEDQQIRAIFDVPEL